MDFSETTDQPELDMRVELEVLNEKFSLLHPAQYYRVQLQLTSE